jgi:predicted nuclease of restriction endonuclease-like RecB superfamily
MLTSELAQSVRRGKTVRPRLLDERDAGALQTARDLIEIVRAHEWLVRAELDAALERYAGAATQYKTLRGLMKILLDECEFETVSTIEPVELRRYLFRAARRVYPVFKTSDDSNAEGFDAHRQLIEDAARQFNCEPEQIEQGLYADTQSNQRLTTMNELTPLELIRRYNLAQAQALLYRAVEMRVWLRPDDPVNSRALFDAVKAHNLIHSIAGDARSGYEVYLTGAVALFHRTQKYGIQMAAFLPALLLCRGWRMRATINAKTFAADAKKSETVLYYELDDAQDLLHSHYLPPTTSGSELTEKLLANFARLRANWSAERTSEIVQLGKTVFVPDLAATNDSGKRIFIEVYGFWTPTHLKRRIEELNAENFRDWIIVASDEMRCSREPLQSAPPNVIICQNAPDARKVLAALETIGAS